MAQVLVMLLFTIAAMIAAGVIAAGLIGKADRIAAAFGLDIGAPCLPRHPARISRRAFAQGPVRA